MLAVCCMSFHNTEYSHHPNFQLISCSVYGAFTPSGAENNFMQGSTIIFISDSLLGSVKICNWIDNFVIYSTTKKQNVMCYIVLYV